MKLVLFLMLNLFVVSLQAQQIESIFPYRICGGKMLVDMKVGTHVHSFIFDTGGQTGFTDNLCKTLGLKEFSPKVVVDANGRKMNIPRVLVPEIQTPDGKFNFSEVPVLKMTHELPFDCFQAEGLIGSDLLQYCVVEIDSREKVIRLRSGENVPDISLRKKLFFAQKGFMPVIVLQAGPGNNLPVLFDTGCPSFLSFKTSDFEGLRNQDSFIVTSEGSGNTSLSVGGEVTDKGTYRVEFPELSLGAVKFKNVSAETSTPPLTLLGMKLLDYGKVIIDYPRRGLYFVLHDKADLDLKEKHYDVNLRVKDGDLVVASVWTGMKGIVEVGDKVVEIDGKPVGKYDFCESITKGIPGLTGKKKVKLTVRTAEGEKVVVYQKK